MSSLTRIIWKSLYANSILKVDKIVSHILKKSVQDLFRKKIVYLVF